MPGSSVEHRYALRFRYDFCYFTWNWLQISIGCQGFEVGSENSRGFTVLPGPVSSTLAKFCAITVIADDGFVCSIKIFVHGRVATQDSKEWALQHSPAIDTVRTENTSWRYSRVTEVTLFVSRGTAGMIREDRDTIILGRWVQLTKTSWWISCVGDIWGAFYLLYSLQSRTRKVR